MPKITFMGAGSTIFARNVIGDCMCRESLRDAHFALYDINGERLKESFAILNTINDNINQGRATISAHFGVGERREALRGADFVVNAINVGGYEPATVTDFEIPKRYGLRQTIADTLGIGGIFRALRTIPVMLDFAHEIEEVAPDAWFLNYTNPMAMLTGAVLRGSGVKAVGLCHSVQVCVESMLESFGMFGKEQYEQGVTASSLGYRSRIAGINHMGWLLKIEDKDGNDLYPEIKRRAAEKNATEKHKDMVRYEYIRRLGYYCTESSEHNAEYNPLFIKSRYPELIEQFNIPLDEYPRRCINQIKGWKEEKESILKDGKVEHTRSSEYASYIMEAMVTGNPYKIGGNVLNTGLIDNLPADACVEVPCLVDKMGVNPCHVCLLYTSDAADD